MFIFKNRIIISTLFLLISIYTLYIYKTVRAQTRCATITGITASTTQVDAGQKFTCNVTVDPASAGSRSIACGVSFDGSFPYDYCPSDQFFGGWNGNTATFNCVIPNTNINAKTVELVGHDFQPGCSPQTGKRLALTLKPGPTTTPTQNDPSAGVALARGLLGTFFGLDSGSKNLSAPDTSVNYVNSNPIPAGCYYTGPTSNGSAGTKGNFVYYCQGNTSWRNTCDLGNSGCGPTSMAMVLSTFGVTMTPPQVDSAFQQNGFRSCSSAGTNMAGGVLKSSWLSGLGFTVGPNLVSGSVLNVQQAKKFIDEGYLIIGSSQSFPCAGCVQSGIRIDHIFVIDDIDPNTNTVSIRDPNNCSYTDGNDENSAKRYHAVNSFPWYYAFPIRGKAALTAPTQPTPASGSNTTKPQDCTAISGTCVQNTDVGTRSCVRLEQAIQCSPSLVCCITQESKTDCTGRGGQCVTNDKMGTAICDRTFNANECTGQSVCCLVSSIDQSQASVPAPTLQPTPTNTSPLSEVRRGPTGKKMVAITLDAGEGSAPFPKMLQAITDAGVKITFFLTGKWARDNPTFVQQISDNGQEIANHTYNHYDLTTKDDKTIQNEINSTETLIAQITGKTTKPLFRFPYGAENAHAMQVVNQMGYRSIYWTIDSQDSIGAPKTAQFLIDRITKQTDAQLDGEIVLMHVGYQTTADALPTIFQNLKDRGFSIVTVSELIK